MENCLSYPLEGEYKEMPEKVFEWKAFFENIKNNVEIFFADELLKAIKILPNDKFEKLFNDLENRINKTYKYFEK